MPRKFASVPKRITFGLSELLVSGIQVMAADDDIHADASGLHELLALRTCLAAHHGCADIVRAYYSSQLSIQQTNVNTVEDNTLILFHIIADFVCFYYYMSRVGRR